MDTVVALWTTFLLIWLCVFCRYLMKPFNYWKERGVPSVPAFPLVGSVGELYFKTIKEATTDRYRKYGKVYGFYESSRPVLSVADPDLLKDILVRDFHIFSHKRDFSTNQALLRKMLPGLQGEEWKRVRTIVMPAFSSGRIKKITSIMAESAKVTAKNLEKCAESCKPVDFKRMLGAFTLDVIARSAFGTSLDSHNDPENEFVRKARGAFESGLTLKFWMYYLFPGVLRLFRTSILNTKPMEFFRDLALDILRHRRKTGEVRNDFLQLMIEANDEVTKRNGTTITKPQHQEPEEDVDKAVPNMKRDELEKGLSDEELVAQCVLFFLAGYETTTSTLSFASYLLALNPECQERLIKEVDDVLQKNKGNVDYEAVQSMKYLESVVCETLRMFPPAVVPVQISEAHYYDTSLNMETYGPNISENRFTRKAAQDYKLGDTGITIEKGMLVQVPVYGIHHDPEFYENPEVFNPDRFSPEAKAERNPYTFLPFGAGPRYCIGKRFAVIETKFCLAVLMSRFRFKRCAETQDPLEFRKGGQGLLHPRSAIMLMVEKRKDKIVCV